MTQLTGEMFAAALAAIPDTPRTEPLRLYSSGPNMTARFKELFGDQFEIIEQPTVGK